MNGYTFGGWYTEASTKNKFIFTTKITKAITLYAKWTIEQVTITYHGNKPSDSPAEATLTGLPDPVNIDYNHTTILPTPPTLAGYNFVAWYTEATATNQFDFSQGITTSIDLYAKWTQDPIVSFNTQGGSPIEPQTLTGTTTKATRPQENPTRDDYAFDDWYTQATGGTLFDFSQTITAQLTTVYARWIQQYTVTYHANKPSAAPTGATVTGMPTTVAVNINLTTAEPTAPELTGYNFAGWYTDEATTTTFAFTTTITANIDLYAKWTQDPVVSFNTQGGSAIEPQTLTGTPKRATRPQENPTRDDYEFNNWYTMATGGELFDFSQTITAQSTTVYARWNRIIRTITYHVNKPDTVPSGMPVTNLPNPATVNVNSGETTTAPIPAPELQDYDFQGWFAGTTTGTTPMIANTAFAFETTAIKADLLMYAKWSRTQITVTFHGRKPSTAPTDASITGLTTDPTIVTVNSGETTAPIPAPLLTGYVLEGWYKATASTTGTLTLENTAFDFEQPVRGENINLYTKWTRAYTITFNHNYGEMPTTSTETTDQEGKVSPPDLSTQRPGYTVIGWFKTNGGSDKIDDFTTEVFNGDITLYAKWRFRPETKATLVAELNRVITDATPSPNLNYIDTSLINDMSNLFKDKSNFNGNISSWNVSLVENMSDMFRDATVFNGNISGWNVSLVKNMHSMFRGATVFNGNISSWNVAKVTNMSNMFIIAPAFNQNISSWNVAKVTNMSYMFSGARDFNQNISSWNVAMVTNMSYMFNFAFFFNQELNNWNVSEVTNMEGMFNSAFNFNQNISSWNVAKVTKYENFKSNSRLTDAQIPEKFRGN